MSAESAKAPLEQGAAPLNFIYACSVCCASFADVYEGRLDTVQGLSDGINPKNRLVTRLFLANCCHVFCSSHLEGGGPPFHPAGQQPKASCPVCIKEKGDSGSRDLYSVRGFNKGEYDPQIPPSWFTAPPIRLDGSGKEMEALRFQYIALIRYCQNTHAARKPLQKSLTDAEKKVASMQELASAEHVKVLSLQQEIEQLRAQKAQTEAVTVELQRLQGLEQEIEHYRRLDVTPRDLETFVSNKAAIRHYLKLVPMLLEQNDKMNRRLASLGFAMALEPVPNFKETDPPVFDSDEVQAHKRSGDSNEVQRKTSSSHTAGRSADTSHMVTAAPTSPFILRPKKRQRVESPFPIGMQIDPPTSRDAMPPPSKPLSKMHSVRKMFPAVRKKFSTSRDTSVPASSDWNSDSVEMMDNRRWQDVRNGGSPARGGTPGQMHYMSGALPLEHQSPATNPKQSQLLSIMGSRDEKSDFRFRLPSPSTISERDSHHRHEQLPTEPSYIRLMDGLSRDTNMELGLKDPRESDTRIQHDHGSSRQVPHTNRGRHDSQEPGSQKRWSLGHPFLQQSALGSSSAVDDSTTSSNDFPTNGYAHSPQYEAAFSPATPSHRRVQQPGHQLENVVSPFFKNRHYGSPMPHQSGLAERKDSSSRSGVFQSQSSKMKELRGGRREPPSLNGLSFFDAPVNARNEVIQLHHGNRELESRPPSRHYHLPGLVSRGFITRPDTMLTPIVNDNVYGSSRNQTLSARHPSVQYLSTVPSSSFRPSAYSRNVQLPSARPSVTTGHSPIRTQPQWENVQRAGIRSSRHSFSQTAGTYAIPARDTFSRGGRRSVRR